MIRIARFFKSDAKTRIDWRAFAPYAALAAAVFAAYANIYGNQFLFDDDTLILQNRYLQVAHPLPGLLLSSVGGGAGSVNDFYRPLQILLYLLIYKIAGFSTIAFHLPNVLLHTANACLLYALGRKTGFRLWAVFFATLLWALHPIHTEAITYISATADPLYGFFCLVGLLVLLPNFSPSRIALACIPFICALLSKETAAVFPLLAMTCIFLVSKKRLDPKTYLCTLPLWFIDALYIVLRLTLLDFQKLDTGFAAVPALHLYSTHVLFRIYTTFASLPAYLELLIYPAGLHLERQFPVYISFTPEVLCGVVLVLAAIAQIVWGRGRKGLALSWGLLWFAAAQSVHTGIIIPLNAFFLEHWMYLPTMGLALGLGQTITVKLEGREKDNIRKVAAAAVLMLALAYGVATYAQNGIWRDAPSLYGTILKYDPSIRAYNNLGKYYMDQGDYPQSLEMYHAALGLADTTPDVHQNIAALLTKRPGWKKHPEEVIAELKRAIEIDPNYLPSYEGLAYVYAVTGDREQEAFYAARAEEIRRQLTP